MRWKSKCIVTLAWVFSVWSLGIISMSSQSNGQAPAFGTCKPTGERTGVVWDAGFWSSSRLGESTKRKSFGRIAGKPEVIQECRFREAWQCSWQATSS
jgi:hypothetical protein